jgi:hypothetical protein
LAWAFARRCFLPRPARPRHRRDAEVDGVYYDDSYDRTLFAPGSNCQGNPGTE